MSRTAPVTKAQNPATRFYEWAGGSDGGVFTHYDKNIKGADDKLGANVITRLPFAFIVLDELSTIRGWCDATESGIFANEVRDTVAEPFVVKSFDGPVIAEGFYRDIRDRVAAAGGRFTANIYIAYKDTDKLKIGAVQFHGAALNAWVEFRKSAGAAIYSKAVKVASFKQGKKGSIVYRTPEFSLIDCSKEADDAAGALQEELKKYHAEYFSRTKKQAAEVSPTVQVLPSPQPEPETPNDNEFADANANPPGEDVAF